MTLILNGYTFSLSPRPISSLPSLRTASFLLSSLPIFLSLYDCMHYIVVKVLGRVSCYYPFVQHEIDDSYPSDIKARNDDSDLFVELSLYCDVISCQSWQGYNTGRELTSPDDTKGLESFNLMGIFNIFQMFNHNITFIEPEDRKTMRAGIDASIWMFDYLEEANVSNMSCVDGQKLVDYFMKKAKRLRDSHVPVAIFVFDGNFLRRWSNYDRRSKTKNEHLSTVGGRTMPDLIFDIIQELQEVWGVGSYLVAPYEADAQLVYLFETGRINVVITKDSDFIAYCCPRRTRSKYLPQLNNEQILQLCLLRGCDYVPGVLDNELFRLTIEQMRSGMYYEDVLRHLKPRLPEGYSLPQYMRAFEVALHIFKHQKVYNMEREGHGELVHLRPISPTEMCKKHMWFLGDEITHESGDKSKSSALLWNICAGICYPWDPYDWKTPHLAKMERKKEQAKQLQKRRQEEKKMILEEREI
ncbi:Rad2 nuclease [Orobanche minor]